MDDKFYRELQLYCLVKIYWHNLKIKEVFEKICRGDVRIKDFMEQMQPLFEFYDNKKKEIEGGELSEDQKIRYIKEGKIYDIAKISEDVTITSYLFYLNEYIRKGNENAIKEILSETDKLLLSIKNKKLSIDDPQNISNLLWLISTYIKLRKENFINDNTFNFVLNLLIELMDRKIGIVETSSDVYIKYKRKTRFSFTPEIYNEFRATAYYFINLQEILKNLNEMSEKGLLSLKHKDIQIIEKHSEKAFLWIKNKYKEFGKNPYCCALFLEYCYYRIGEEIKDKVIRFIESLSSKENIFKKLVKSLKHFLGKLLKIFIDKIFLNFILNLSYRVKNFFSR